MSDARKNLRPKECSKMCSCVKYKEYEEEKKDENIK